MVPGSGIGWQLFTVSQRPGNVGAELKCKIKLDYEQPSHRSGYKFKIEVTDKVSSMLSSKEQKYKSSFLLIFLMKYSETQVKR